MLVAFFFFNDTATTEIYTLSLHDALPISGPGSGPLSGGAPEYSQSRRGELLGMVGARDRKSTRLNSSHTVISYAVFCLKKKMITIVPHIGAEFARETNFPSGFRVPETGVG